MPEHSKAKPLNNVPRANTAENKIEQPPIAAAKFPDLVFRIADGSCLRVKANYTERSPLTSLSPNEVLDVNSRATGCISTTLKEQLGKLGEFPEIALAVNHYADSLPETNGMRRFDMREFFTRYLGLERESKTAAPALVSKTAAPEKRLSSPAPEPAAARNATNYPDAQYTAQKGDWVWGIVRNYQESLPRSAAEIKGPLSGKEKQQLLKQYAALREIPIAAFVALINDQREAKPELMLEDGRIKDLQPGEQINLRELFSPQKKHLAKLQDLAGDVERAEEPAPAKPLTPRKAPLASKPAAGPAKQGPDRIIFTKEDADRFALEIQRALAKQELSTPGVGDPKMRNRTIRFNPDLVVGLIEQESHFNALAVGPRRRTVGGINQAQGCTQVMPPTAREQWPKSWPKEIVELANQTQKRLNIPAPKLEEKTPYHQDLLKNPVVGITLAYIYLDWLKRLSNSDYAAVASYNTGWRNWRDRCCQKNGEQMDKAGTAYANSVIKHKDDSINRRGKQLASAADNKPRGG